MMTDSELRKTEEYFYAKAGRDRGNTEIETLEILLDGVPGRSGKFDPVKAQAAVMLAYDEAPEPHLTEAKTPLLVSVDSVERQEIRWLWLGRIPLGKVSLIVGDPGTGKSHMMLDCAARVTRGGAWPDQPAERAPEGQVILLSAEDDVADTIRPRLEVAGADIAKVKVLQAVQYYDRGKGTTLSKHFSLEVDLDMLEKAVVSTPGTRLLIIDPISAYLGASVDSHKNSDIRGLLAPLAELAARFDMAVSGITHLNKSHNLKAMYRATGSLAFVAAARAVWAVTKDEENPDRRLFLPIKVNIARDSQGLAFSLEPSPDCPGIAKIQWEPEPVSVTVDDVLSPDEGDRSERAEAADWLSEELSEGPVPVNKLKNEAERAGLSWRTVRRTKDKLGIVPKKASFKGGWIWELPTAKNAKVANYLEDDHVSDVDTLGKSGHLREPELVAAELWEEGTL